jgi:hypothetical protein
MPENIDDDTYNKICKEDLEFFGPPGPGERYISYRPPERVHRVQVRMLIKVVSGNQAKHIDLIQAKAIMEYLRWCRNYRQQQDQQKHAQNDQGTSQPDSPGK